MTYFRQCIMSKNGIQHTAWIPEIWARKGETIRIKFDGKWDGGWTVSEVGTRDTEENVLANERDYTRQRKASDV